MGPLRGAWDNCPPFPYCIIWKRVYNRGVNVIFLFFFTEVLS